MSLLAILVLALALAVTGRRVRLAVRIALLSLLIALVIAYGSQVARRARRAAPPTPAIQRHEPR